MSKKESLLNGTIKQAVKRFPKLFDAQLKLGLYRLFGCTSSCFIEERSSKHLEKILLTQYFLQKRIEFALSREKQPHREVFIRIFHISSRLCIGVALSFQRQSEIFTEQHVLSAVRTLLAGIEVIPHSSYTWQFPEQPYLFSYLEIQKLRGKDLSTKELKRLQVDLESQLLPSITSCCPAVFWPYNHEESYRQILALNKEIHHLEDLPQVTIHFKEQSTSELEFLIYLAHPKTSITLEAIEQRLSPSMRILSHFSTQFTLSQAFAFSLFLPTSQPIQTINLLKARQAIVAFLEEVIGPFRDVNGGLFTKQEEVFLNLKAKLEDQIPGFSLFAEKFFYALKPIEKQITLSLEEAEPLFRTFSNVMFSKKSFFFQHHEKGIFVVKSKDREQIASLMQQTKELPCVFLQLGNTYFHVFLDSSEDHIHRLVKRLSDQNTPMTFKRKTLRIAMQIGPPPSFNPHYLAPDLRCRTVYKALFEGLTRMNTEGEAVFAGAQKMECSEDGLIYTFSLRLNRWHNGERVTAHHYVQGWKEVFTSRDRFSAHAFCLLKNGEKVLRGEVSPDHLGVYALDDSILEVHLQHPDPYFLQKLAQPLFFPAYDQNQEPKVFNGPYFVHSLNTNRLILECNPYFWNYQQIYFDRIEFKKVSDVEQGMKLFNQREIDWLGDPFFYLHDEKVYSSKGMHYRKVNRPVWIFFNMKDPLLRRSSIRHALRCSIDLQKWKRAYGMKCTPHIDLNVSLSKKYFKKNSHELCSFTFSYSSNIVDNSLVKTLKKGWKEHLGVEIKPNNLEWNTLFHKLQKGDFQIAGCFVAPLLEARLEFLERMMLNNPLNFSQFHHQKYTDLITRARKTSHSKQKTILLKEAEAILSRETPFVSLFNRDHTYMHTPSMQGYVFDKFGGVDLCYAFFKE